MYITRFLTFISTSFSLIPSLCIRGTSAENTLWCLGSLWKTKTVSYAVKNTVYDTYIYVYILPLTWHNENKCCYYILYSLLVYFVYQNVYYIFFSVHFLHAFFLPSVSCECCVWHIGRPGSRYWQCFLSICMFSQLR
jgi:hypothetical protein